MSWNPDDWQQRIVLLATRYHGGSAGFQEVPDSHGGDGGIEGFSLDGTGIGYQCYVPEENATTPLPDRIKNKIYDDTNKLKKNSAYFAKLLDPVVLKRWILMIPQESFRDKSIVTYAAERTKAVTSWALPFIDTDFRIVVSYGNEFEQDEQKLKALLSPKLVLPACAEAADADISKWEAENTKLALILDDKLSRTDGSNETKKIVREEMIKFAVVGQNTLNKLKNDNPEAWMQIVELKGERAAELRLESATTSQVPTQFLQTTLDSYRHQLSQMLPELDRKGSRILANEAVADWLMTCPLDFFTKKN